MFLTLKKNKKGLVVVTKKLSYDRDKALGSGSYGTVVYRGLFENRPVAVKKMIRRQKEIVDREVLMLQKTDSHQNIVRYFCTEMNDDFYFIALELCFTSLHEYFSARLSDMRKFLGVKAALNQTVDGLSHLHSKNISELRYQKLIHLKNNLFIFNVIHHPNFSTQRYQTSEHFDC